MREIADIHLPFMAWLNKIGIPFHRNRPDKRTTATVGDPDFLVCWMGHCVYIECKVPGKTLSDAQEKRVAYIRAAGNKVIVAYSLEMCIEACRNILCIGEATKEAVAAEKTLRTESASSSGAEKQAGGSSDCVTSAPSASLFIAKICGVDWVCSGDATPGGTLNRVRRATPADIINIRTLAAQ